jgi:hypothetical protein
LGVEFCFFVHLLSKYKGIISFIDSIIFNAYRLNSLRRFVFGAKRDLVEMYLAFTFLDVKHDWKFKDDTWRRGGTFVRGGSGRDRFWIVELGKGVGDPESSLRV